MIGGYGAESLRTSEALDPTKWTWPEVASTGNYEPREPYQPNRHERRKEKAGRKKLKRQVKATLKRLRERR